MTTDATTDVTTSASTSASTEASRQGDPLRQWCAAMDDAYPPREAADWDQVGLHVGDPVRDRVRGVLVALDVTTATLAEAARVGADLLVAHHPLLFSPARRLTPATAPTRLALAAARQGCAIFAAHTNVDQAADGTSHPAATTLGLTDLRPIVPLPDDAATDPVKLVTFAPVDATRTVLGALADAGAGQIGDYAGCAFTARGQGTFVPGEGTDPHIGAVGRRETVDEDRIEAVTTRGDLPRVRRALLAAHPYEEVPVDVYPLIDDDRPGRDRGLGLIGRLPHPMALRDIAAALAEGLPSPQLRLAAVDGDADALATTVAICGGAGDSLIPRLLGPDGPRADVYVTGDLKHHPTLDALTMGLSVIDAGHFATEDPAMDAVVGRLDARRDAFDLAAPIHRSRITTEPWTEWRPDHA